VTLWGDTQLLNECINTDADQKKGLSLQRWFAGIAAAQWLGLSLQSIAAFVITLVALLAVLGHQGLLPFAVSDGKFAASESAHSSVGAVLDRVIVGCARIPAYRTQGDAWQTCVKTFCRHGS